MATACDAALALPFYGLYSIVRGLLGPYVVFRMVVFYSGGGAEGAIATWVVVAVSDLNVVIVCFQRLKQF